MMTSYVVKDDIHLQLNAAFDSTRQRQIFQLIPTRLASHNLPHRTVPARHFTQTTPALSLRTTTADV